MNEASHDEKALIRRKLCLIMCKILYSAELHNPFASESESSSKYVTKIHDFTFMPRLFFVN